MLLHLLACEEPPPEVHKLLDLYRPTLQLNTGVLPGGSEQVQLLVHPQFPGLCHPIPGLVATLDGTPMERLHGRVAGPPPYDRDCSVFEFTVDGAKVVAQATNTVVVTDGASTYTVEVANLFAPRAMVPSSTAFSTGESLTLVWSPSTDVVRPKGPIGFVLQAGDQRAVVKREALGIGAGTFSLAIPAGIVGEVTLSAFGTDQIAPAVLRCEGPTTCDVSRTYDVAPLAITVKG